MTAPMPETMSLREKVAAFLKERDEACGVIDADDVERDESAGLILAALVSSGDHAELASRFEALAVEASAARNLDGASSMMVDVQAIYDLIVSRNDIIAENAALRIDRNGSNRAETVAVHLADTMADRATEAERKLADAEALLRRWRSDLPSEALEDLTDAFISNQGDHR